MRTLIGVQGHAGGQESINVNARFWPKTDIIGLQGIDSPAEWPENIQTVITSPVDECKWVNHGLRPTIFVESLRALAHFAYHEKYDQAMWTECDSILLGPIPECDPLAMNCVIAGYCPPEWNCGGGPFIHPPYLMSVITAVRWMVSVTLPNNDIEESNGTIDAFVPIVCKRTGIPVKQMPGTYSCNGLDMRLASKMKEARAAAKAGCWHIHGIKRQDHLDYILGLTDAFPADTIQ